MRNDPAMLGKDDSTSGLRNDSVTSLQSHPQTDLILEDGLVLEPWEGPAILLVDLDAFFASVEQLDHPGWRGKPVIVGGDADKRGVVSTASYEARAFGVHSAMPSSQAARLCPQAIWTRGRFTRYREISNLVMDILRDETPRVQQVSIDEAFLDVTPTRCNREHPVLIAQRIQRRVRELGVTCSVGVGTSKTVAKIASDMDKPCGLTVVYPGSEKAFLDPLPVRTLSGVGKVAEEKLHSRGIATLGDLSRADERMLVRLFGKNGRTMHLRALGADDTPLIDDSTVKSVSNETSFAEDLVLRSDVESALAAMAAKVGRRLRKKGLAGTCLGLKLRLGDRAVRSAQCQLSVPTDDEFVMLPELRRLLSGVWHEGIPVRLVGVSMSGFSDYACVQESLFEESLFGDDTAAFESSSADTTQRKEPALFDEQRRRGLLKATDSVRDRFGESAVAFGSELRTAQNTTGSAAKNPADYK
ncbi:DNA polymerase IV [Adlercreutzia sp. ZJ141]|uniref:DNA polymerase IV n=1 Tax=Adlercreutzia sp. ZJ141 TaxID=2709406 RepID=UPI001F14F2C0|nr:DNA polymerase IV [Adlercreutzia sp. ZJ141]